jgi:hypothetical protein
MVVGKSSSRVNEEMGRVPILMTSWPDHELGIQTHAILLRKERKEGNSWAKGDIFF